MASNTPDIDIFKETETLINKTFRRIINRIKSRRDAIFLELKNLKFEYETRNKANTENLHELEEMRSQLEQLAIKQNFALTVQKSSLTDIDLKISNLKSEMQKPNLTFECHLSQLSEDITNLGNIIVEQPNPVQVSTAISRRYSLRQKSVTIGRKGREEGNFNCPQKLHIDSTTGLLYVADYYNNRIQVFNTNDWSFLLYFPTQKQVYPNSVATNMEFCYVTSFSSNTVLQFSQSNLQLVRSVDRTGGSFPKLNGPSHVALSPRDEVFVADWNNNRVCVFNRDLAYQRELGVGVLHVPKHIAFSGDLVYVLDDNEDDCMHVFNDDGMLVRSFLKTGVEVLNPTSFAIDQLGNMAVTDYASDSVKVFSPEGAMVVVSGDTNEENGYFSVVMCGDRYVVSCRHSNCVKVL